MSEAKRQKMTEEDQSATKKSKIEFCALNDDCILQILDWLSIAELAAIKITCKRFYLLANEHFRRTYKNNFVHFSEDFEKLEITVEEKYFQLFKFHMPRVDLEHAGNETFELIVRKMKENTIKYISIWKHKKLIEMNAFHCDYVKDALQNVEVVELADCLSINNLLKHCPKLQYLMLENIKPEELSHAYPTLKQLDWASSKFCPQLKDFLVINPNITTFYAYNQPAIRSTNWLLENRIIIDDLLLKLSNKDNEEDMDKLIENFHSLHKNQQVKRLHLVIERSFLLRPKLNEVKFLKSVHFNINTFSRVSVDVLGSMTNLTYLFYFNKHHNHFDVLAQKLTELEEFQTISIGSIYELMPFVRHSRKLKTIYLIGFVNRIEKTTLQSLDKERRQMKNSCKLTIYVDEQCYLKLKSNSSTNSYGLMEIKRAESYPFSKHPMRPNIF